MKSTMLLAVLSLLAVAGIQAKNIGTLRALPDIGSASPPRNQWYTLDEQRRANFGYAYPGQAASNIRDSEGNMAGSWSYVDADGNLVRASYTADKRGFLVSSTNEGRVAPNVLSDLSKVGTTPKVGACNNVGRSDLKNPKTFDMSEYRDLPFLVGLTKRKEGDDSADPVFYHFCAGSLISTTHVLTSAHCITEQNSNKLVELKRFDVRLGITKQSDQFNYAEQSRSVSKISIHPDYDYKTHENDIAIIKLSSPVTTSSSVAPICLVPKCFENDDAEVVALGWGTDSYDGKLSEFVRYAFLTAMKNEQCKVLLKGENLPSSTICAVANNEKTKDTCPSDYGGPLVIKGDAECNFKQVGIVSYGKKCVEGARTPSVYTKVASFLPWIAEQTA